MHGIVKSGKAVQIDMWIDFGKTKRFVITRRPIYCTPEVVVMLSWCS